MSPACTQILTPVFNITMASQHSVDIFVSLTAGLAKCNLIVSNAIESRAQNEAKWHMMLQAATEAVFAVSKV